MYYPYFRGKQYELILIRENASLFKDSHFIPIIEPVKESFNGLERSINELQKEHSEIILIINPYHGDHSLDNNAISEFVEKKLGSNNSISIGILLKSENDLEFIKSIPVMYQNRSISIIHYGFADVNILKPLILNLRNITRHIFIDGYSGRLYRKHFSEEKRILIRDGFQRRTNKDHPECEMFSDLHLTFEDENVTGFGDFLIVGDDYSESGGPAYTVAIHITYIDETKDNEMWVQHFKSDTNETPTDPAGKFAEALKKLIVEVDKPNSKILKTAAIAEFNDLYLREHFPGLGYVKKLSMQHHIEVMAKFMNGR